MVELIFLSCLLNVFLGGIVCNFIYTYDHDLEYEAKGITGLLHLFFWPVVVFRFFSKYLK